MGTGRERQERLSKGDMEKNNSKRKMCNRAQSTSRRRGNSHEQKDLEMERHMNLAGPIYSKLELGIKREKD